MGDGSFRGNPPRVFQNLHFEQLLVVTLELQEEAALTLKQIFGISPQLHPLEILQGQWQQRQGWRGHILWGFPHPKAEIFRINRDVLNKQRYSE